MRLTMTHSLIGFASLEHSNGKNASDPWLIKFNQDAMHVLTRDVEVLGLNVS